MSNELVLTEAETRAAQLREKDRLRKRAERAEARKRQAIDRESPDSTEVLDKKEALEILRARGITTPSVPENCYRFGAALAQSLGIPANKFFWEHGPSATLSKQAAEIADGDQVPVGELLDRKTLFALYEYSGAQTKDLVSFTEWLQQRHNVKTNCFYLGKTIFENDFSDVHREWQSFFPAFNPDTLPAKYNLRQALKWLSEASTTKNYLLLASRQIFKSAFSHLWALSLIVTLPDVQLLLVSEGSSLSGSFIEVIRKYFECIPGQLETRFNRLFCEFTIKPGEGSVLSLEPPVGHLNLPQKIQSASMKSGSTGQRAMVLVMDDCCTDVTCKNETEYKDAIAKMDSILKLRTVGGYCLVLGTPWNAEDMYAEIIKRNEADPSRPWAIRIDPAYQIKPEHANIPLKSLTEEMVTLRFPERLTFEYLQSEARANEEFFKSQNLCYFPKTEAQELKCVFTEELIDKHCCPRERFNLTPATATYMAVDLPLKESKYSDLLACPTAKMLVQDGKNIAFVTDFVLERCAPLLQAQTVVRAIERNRPSKVYFEEVGQWDLWWKAFQDELTIAVTQRGLIIPEFIVRSPSLAGSWVVSKPKRIKNLEILLTSDCLWFCNGVYLNELKDEFSRWDGGVTRSNSHRKDCGLDALGMLIHQFYPRQNPEPPKTEEQKAEEETKNKKEMEDARRKGLYNNMWNNSIYTLPAAPPQEEKSEWEYVPGYEILPPNMRPKRKR